MRERLKDLERIAAAAHAGDVDKQGVPYIEHLRAVAGAVSERAKPVALFHDALEDSALTRDELAGILSQIELAAVTLLTRQDGQSYDEYIERVATWPGVVGELAREAKRADVEHNLGRLTPDLESLRGRYERALDRLS